jgi:hypothetical protein
MPRYVQFLLWSVGITIGIAVVGWPATYRWGGSAAVVAMMAGCCVSFLASALGAVPLVQADRRPGGNAARAILTSMLVRFAAALAGGLALAVGSTLERAPLLIWLAISYLALLVADVRYAVAAVADAAPEGP